MRRMRPCFGSAVAAVETASNDNMTAARARTPRMLSSLEGFLRPCLRPVARNDSHGDAAEQPVRPQAALAIRMNLCRKRKVNARTASQLRRYVHVEMRKRAPLARLSHIVRGQPVL